MPNWNAKDPELPGIIYSIKVVLMRILSRPWTVPLFLLLICAAAYGTMLSKLGFYWDDWTIAWYIHFLGPASFQPAFASDRPLLAGIYFLTTSILGESMLAWHTFAVFTRWLSCLAMWWLLSGLWPGQQVRNLVITLLFAVYPGFSQIYIAITYSNLFLLYSLYISSLAIMVWAFRKPNWFWPLYLLSIFIDGYCIFTTEYFFGLDLIRPALIWIVIYNPDPGQTNNIGQSQLRRVALYWIPYLLISLAFIVWRGTYETPRASITIFEKLATGPVTAIIEILKIILQDIWQVVVVAWLQVLDFQQIKEFGQAAIIKYLLMVMITSIFVFLYLWFYTGKHKKIAPGKSFAPRRQEIVTSIKQAALPLILGIFALITAGIPIWLTNLKIELYFPWDRFTIPMMVGASLLAGGVLELLQDRRWLYPILVGIMIGLAVGLHYRTALVFRKDWLMQRDFFWQLSWRAPSIKPGTILLTSELPFPFDWDNSLTAPLNWTFAPNLQSFELPYLVYNVESRLSSGLPGLEKDTQIEEFHRITPFKGSTAQTILIYYRPPGSCLKIIDPLMDQHMPEKPRYFRDALAFSNPNLIVPNPSNPAHPPLNLLGPEPHKDWCYYFEKAELARQQGDWQEVVNLGNIALKSEKTFQRKNVTELLPFIEGYANTGNFDQAVKLTLQAFGSWENSSNILCELWNRVSLNGKLEFTGKESIQIVQKTLNCIKSN